jgi:hypothetical protein
VITIRSIPLASALALLLAATAAPAATMKDVEEAMSYDGLQKIQVKGADLAYARPGATLAGYDRVKLDPVEVSFSKSWDPKKTGSSFKLSAEDRENIRTGVATLVREEFVKALQTNSTYKVTDESGPDVLRVRASIVNLYVNAPATPTSGRSRTYSVSAGEMTIAAELYDSESGQVLARMVDRREARSTGTMQISNSVSNAGEARSIAALWANILRKALDNAHGIGGK